MKPKRHNNLNVLFFEQTKAEILHSRQPVSFGDEIIGSHREGHFKSIKDSAQETKIMLADQEFQIANHDKDDGIIDGMAGEHSNSYDEPGHMQDDVRGVDEAAGDIFERDNEEEVG